jgi:two-component system sensor histidine kinase KdpD
LDTADLLSMAAHELRAPLNALALASEFLAEDFNELDQHEICGMITAIHRSSLWLQGLVENLLSAATINQGRLQVLLRPTDFADIVGGILPVVQTLLNRKHQRLLVPDQLPWVVADGPRIGQVLINLISNAGRHAPAGSVIELRLSCRGQIARVAVADRGPGLPKKGRSELFRPYTRGPSAADDRTLGAGLGLSIVRSIVEAHGGCVGAANRRGGGAEFWFEIPSLSVVRGSQTASRRPTSVRVSGT